MNNFKIEQIKNFMFNSKYNNKLYDTRERIVVLKDIKKWIINNNKDISDALKKDLNKSEIETYLSEVNIVLSSIDDYVKKINKFFKPKKIKSKKVDVLFSQGYTYYKPKGTTLLINPFNYPFVLSVLPWVTNIAAGNYTIFKNSPKTPNINRVIERMTKEVQNSNTIFLEDTTSKENLFSIIANKVDLVFFTGGEVFGNELKKVCYHYDVKVILELGSACPVIVDETANLDEFAKRVTWAKLFNSGQTCVSPNSIYIHKDVYNEALAKLREQFDVQYFKNNNYEFARLIDKQHLEGILTTVEKATNVKLKHNLSNLVIEPTIIEVDINNPILNKEIFGPVFFVTKYDDKIDFIKKNNSINDSLAFYLFSNDKNFIEIIKKRYDFGCLSINEALIHVNNPQLPFGGINKSGVGKYHGEYGLMEFSNIMSMSVGGKLNIKMRYFQNLNKYKKMLMKKY